MSGRTAKLATVNVATKKTEVIEQTGIVVLNWGLRFFVASELEAFKAAYEYRNNPHGAEVAFSATEQKWMVMVFNDKAAAMGITAAK